MSTRTLALVSILTACAGCKTTEPVAHRQTFAGDLAFLREHTDVVVLNDNTGDGLVLVSPGMQGRVLTSSAGGPDGFSFGWINRALISSGQVAEHINVYGGEDRFWMGPEGGQFSIFFAKGVPFDLEHWYTPAAIDTEPWELTVKSQHSATLRKTMRLTNYSGTVFDVRVDREVRVLNREMALQALGIARATNAKMVAFESNNRVTNVGQQPWKHQTGLLSIWILGMFRPSPETTVVIPYARGPQDRLGPIVNDAYFGKVPPDRLVIKDGVLFFSGDGQYRSKIGLSPRRAKEVCGSYDATNKVLTIVQYNKPESVLDYVNSMWELQVAPYRGDVVNSYNDGPPEPGKEPMGPFYELESSSPAAALAPGQSLLHTHRTVHFQADEADLDPIARTVLGVSIGEIQSALP